MRLLKAAIYPPFLESVSPAVIIPSVGAVTVYSPDLEPCCREPYLL